MRLNPIILALSALIGVFSLVFGVRAFTTYNDASEAFTRIELQYIPDSFEWQDPDFERGRARFRIVNDSAFDATVESFSISLRFGGEFAGSDYEPWQEMTVPGNESREIPATFTVTANSIQSRGGTADLGFTGQLFVRFAEFEQPLSFRFRGTIGTTDYVGS